MSLYSLHPPELLCPTSGSWGTEVSLLGSRKSGAACASSTHCRASKVLSVLFNTGDAQEDNSKAAFVSAHNCWCCAENSHHAFFFPGWLQVLHRDGSYWNKLPFIQVHITILALYLSVLIILSPSSTAYISMLSIWVLWLLYQRAQTSYQLFWICPFFIPSLALLDSVAWQNLETYQSLYIAEVIYLASQTFSSCLSSLGSLNHFHYVLESLPLWFSFKRYLSPELLWTSKGEVGEFPLMPIIHIPVWTSSLNSPWRHMPAEPSFLCAT